MASAFWYIRNSYLHKDLGIQLVAQKLRKFAGKHDARLHHHTNPESLQLLNNQHLVRRLKRTNPFELQLNCYKENNIGQ